MFLFPTSSGEVSTSLIPYVEDLGNLNSYAWAFPVHESVVASLVAASKRFNEDPNASVNFGGCSIVVIISCFIFS